jgi:hypothetical protein
MVEFIVTILRRGGTQNVVVWAKRAVGRKRAINITNGSGSELDASLVCSRLEIGAHGSVSLECFDEARESRTLCGVCAERRFE